MNPLLVGLISGTGQAMGEITGYLAGFSGSDLSRRTNIYLKIQHWMLRRGWIVLFILAIITNPLFDLAGIAAGACTPSRMEVPACDVGWQDGEVCDHSLSLLGGV